MAAMGEQVGAGTERELVAPVALCEPSGRLAQDAIGWARSPLIDCSLPGRWGRRKRWDFWCVTGPGFAMNLTVADVDYLGLVDVWFRDLEAGAEATKTAPRLPPRRRLPLAPHAGEARIDHRGLGLELGIEDRDDGTVIRVRFATKRGPFESELVVDRPPGHESLTVVIPWSARRYQCTTKDVGRPARGTIRWGERTWDLRGDGDAWGCLDYGRGRWPYRIRWNWGAAAGLVGGRRIGLQLGGKWTDGTGMTENALVVDCRLSKLSEELVWEYDTSDWLAPWRIRTPQSDRVDVTFTPVHDKVSRLQAGIAASTVDQCFGTYAGRIVPDDGVPIEVDGLFGWAEEATWRW
jgi:hypothetical protein